MSARIYELSFDGYRLGLYPTEAEARQRAGYMPRGRYIIREWADIPDFMEFDPERNKLYEFNN